MFVLNKSSRKERSEKVLAKHKVSINPNLPGIDDSYEKKIRPVDEVLKRALTAFITVQIAIDICNDNGASESVEFFTPIMERFGVMEELTEDEKPYFDLNKCDEISKDAAYQCQWRLEMCVPLFWALGMWKKLDYPSEMTDTTPLIHLIGGCQSFTELKEYVKPRTSSEILDAADLLLRMDWACVEARIKNNPGLSADLSSDVVVEQHKGINWLIQEYDAEDWDNVLPHT